MKNTCSKIQREYLLDQGSIYFNMKQFKAIMLPAHHLHFPRSIERVPLKIFLLAHLTPYEFIAHYQNQKIILILIQILIYKLQLFFSNFY